MKKHRYQSILIFLMALTGFSLLKAQSSCVHVHSLSEEKAHRFPNGYPENVIRKMALAKSSSLNLRSTGIRVRFIASSEAVATMGGNAVFANLTQIATDSLSGKFADAGMGFSPSQFVRDGYEDHPHSVLFPTLPDASGNNLGDGYDWSVANSPVGAGTADVIIFIRNGSFPDNAGLGGLTFGALPTTPNLNHLDVDLRGYIVITSTILTLLTSNNLGTRRSMTSLLSHEIGHDFGLFLQPAQSHKSTLFTGFVMNPTTGLNWEDSSKTSVRASANLMNSSAVTAGFPMISFPVLPLELLDFTGKLDKNDKITLNWRTATEQNTEAFDVEQSADAKTFEKIGTVKARGSNSTYVFTDEQGLKGITYYRLKIKDFDGKTSYSKVLSFNAPNASKVRIFPTYTEGSLFMENVKTFEIVNPLGQVVSTVSNIQHLPSGMYFVQGTDTNGAFFTQKVFKY
jgi:hypothetical protein